ncbi:MAG: hypothetical protein HS114_15540 [Anaerolineales bacterium]|nr:hypothetical protein [Anaerolineales bacterium]
MNLAELMHDRFPLVYEQGRPVAVLVDFEVFQRLVDALARLQKAADDEDEAAWIEQIIGQVRAYRQAHPEELMTFDSPEAILAALDAPDD